MFRLSIDPDRNLIKSWFEGFLTIDEVRNWHRQEQAASAAIAARSGRALLLVDSSRCAIQSQEVVALFQTLIATSTHKAHRIAIMQGGSLTKMQTRRIAAGNAHIEHFADTASAEAWLFEGATTPEARVSPASIAGRL